MRALSTVGMLFLAVICSGFLAAVAYGTQLALPSVLLGELAGTVFGFFAAVIAIPAFMAGAAVPGVTMWLILWRTRWNQPLPAALVGGIMTSLVGGPILLFGSNWDVWPLALPFPMAGAVGGWMFQRMMSGEQRPESSR